MLTKVVDGVSWCFTSITDFYHYLMIEVADPRTNDWFLVQSPIIWPMVFGYVYCVLKLGPRLMKNRKAYELNTALIVYNFIQVVISAYLFIEGFYYGWFNGYNWKCQPVDYSNNPKALRAAHACYWYYMAKIFELLDTVFFVLRKKNNQVSVLHVYHHSIMPLISWGVTKYYAGGHGTFIPYVNSFTHIFMYFYYMITAMGPEYQKYTWWKKYITALQLIQFCMIFIHGMFLWIYDCDFPKWPSWLILPNVIFFYYLFSEFYKMSYGNKPNAVIEKPPKKENEDQSSVTAKSTTRKSVKIGLSTRQRK